MAIADAEYLGDGRPDGTILGRTPSELIAFYGSAPGVQASTIAAITVTQPLVTVFGFQTTAQFNNLIAAVNQLIANQKAIGFMAT